ncbi:type II secretion system F family protein [Allosphingosinicella vermicomposti]|uniref:type II secretion system F family protein n=1 Tax=Allosphingosinicella vermicomposti TaxID=614671 RepID=UPI000D0F27D5|nr:type II secretion system F family protein [Allosphingosinicella vermicomposti]
MTEFRCIAISSEGREIRRVVEAGSSKSAAARLIADGLTPLEIKSGALSLADRLNQPIRIGSGIGLAEQSLILTQLATLNTSGLPVDRSLDLLREQSPRPAQRDFLAQVLAGVRAGQGLAQALERQNIFPDYVIGVLRSAEKSGQLSEALTALATRMTETAATRRQLITSLTYPAAVFAATIIALVLVLTVVVPQFEPVFAGEEERLPNLTRAVLALSAAVTDHGLIALSALLAVAILGFVLLRTGLSKVATSRFRHRIPGLTLRDQYLAAEFTGLLSTLVGNGVTVIAALPLARSAIGSRRWRGHIREVEQRVREGASLSLALASGAFVPRTAVRLIEVGERSGQLAETCQKASRIMGDGARARIERIVSLANPIAIVSLGGIVALLVAGVMLGIFAIGDFAG